MRNEGKRPPWRPSIYTEELALDICSRLACGESLNAICRTEGYPCKGTVINWAMENREGFGDKYKRAREIQAETFADDLVDISDDGRNDWMEGVSKRGEATLVLNREHIERSRLRVATRQWIAARILHHKFGDKSGKNQDNTEDGVVYVENSPDAQK